MLELIERFLVFSRHNRGRSERTGQVYRLALLRLNEFFVETKRHPLKATHDDLLVFSGIWLHRKGLRDPLSRKPMVAGVRGFYRWLAQTGQLANDPAATLPYPASGRKLPKVLTLANAEKLMWAPDYSTFEGVRDSAMLALLIGCGLRVTGLVKLNDSNIVSDVIDKRPRLVLNVVEKRNKERRLTVPEQADLLLRLYLEHPDLKEIDRALPSGDQVLFVSTRNRMVPAHEYRGEKRRMSRGAVLDLIKRHGRPQGIPENQLHPHALRHLFGTELREDDVDANTRKNLLGHEDLKSTEIYDHLAQRKATRELDRANPLAKMSTPASDLLKQLKTRN